MTLLKSFVLNATRKISGSVKLHIGEHFAYSDADAEGAAKPLRPAGMSDQEDASKNDDINMAEPGEASTASVHDAGEPVASVHYPLYPTHGPTSETSPNPDADTDTDIIVEGELDYEDAKDKGDQFADVEGVEEANNEDSDPVESDSQRTTISCKVMGNRVPTLKPPRYYNQDLPYMDSGYQPKLE